jgi:hypothetical protein
MSVSVLRKGLPVAVMVALLSLVGAVQAGAVMPWWHLNTYSAPASKAGGEGTVTVNATNLGDAATKTECVKIAESGSPLEFRGKYTNSACTIVSVPANKGEWEQQVVPITIVDTLPEGVTVTETASKPNIVGTGESFTEGTNNSKSAKMSCPTTPAEVKPDPVTGRQTVTCTYVGGLNHYPIPAYDALTVAINVKVEPGAGTGQNEVSVSGGGAATVTSKKMLALSDSPSPYGVESYEITPEEEGGLSDTLAGSHPFQLTTTISLNAQTARVLTNGPEEYPQVQPIGSFTKDLRFNLPPGLVGNPVPLPQCPTNVFLHQGQAGAAQCRESSVVGVASAVTSGSRPESPLLTNPLYSLNPPIGEPARFAFNTPGGPVFLDTSVRTGSDYGVVVTVPNITEALEFVRAQVTFWGVPARPQHNTTRGKCLAHLVNKTEEVGCPPGVEEKPFLIMPTSCAGALETSVEDDLWSQPGQFTTKEYKFQNIEGELLQQNGCEGLNFEPKITVKSDGEQASTPTGLVVDVHVPQEASLNPIGQAESSVKDTTVMLPTGVALNPAGADGLETCPEALVGYLPGESTPPEVLRFTPRLPGSIAAITAGETEQLRPGVNFCPEAAKVGTVEIHTPLLAHELEGAVYLAAQSTNPFGSLVALYIVAEDPVSGVLVKLAGEVKPQDGSGQLVSTFEDTPQLPFEDLTLHFFGGSRAPLGTPALCGSYTTSASFKSWSGNTANVSSPPFQITSGPNGGPCRNPLPFSPSLTTGALNLQAGAFTPFTLTMSREDGNQSLDAIQLKMPPGLLGTLSSVKLCEEPAANAGLCGPESLIGETTVSVGLGGNPFSVRGGRVYITGPYEGAPYGLSIVNPAKAGPFDLENTPAHHPACDCVVVRAKIEVDPLTAALTITSDSTGPYAIPQMLEGIPLQIQHVNVTVNRQGFTFNPTNCSAMRITGALTSSQGATSALSVPFQVTNCATLAFKPQFSVSTSGKTSRANGASLHVKLVYPKAPFGSQASIAKVKVNLPKQLPSRLTTLQKACLDSVFAANPAACPAASRIGTAKALTPIIPVPLTGPAYFVSHGGAKFPELVIVLSGYGTTVQLHAETFISKAGITSSTFRQVPDVPVGTFELTLPQGKYSALAANGILCKSKLKMPTAFTAQNGAVIHQSTPIGVTGCPKAKKRAKKK